MTWPIRLTGVNGTVISYTQSEAQAVLAGYAFGQVPLTWTAPSGLPPGSGLAAPPAASYRYRWAYWTFDCVLTDPHRIEIKDIVLTAALDSSVSGAAVLGVEAIRDDLNEVLTRIPVTTAFWDLPAADLGADPQAAGGVSWWVWRAWVLLMGLRGIDRAITHKLLHRKRPWLFPMLDAVTSEHLGRNRAWATIHNDLDRHRPEFIALEEWFAEQASARDGVQLTRLRIHDILLWAELSGNRHGMQDLGRPFLDTERLLISPANLAHFPGCDHKDDDDFGQWAELDLPNAWERLGNGEKLPATGGARPDRIATGRCKDCVAHGPW